MSPKLLRARGRWSTLSLFAQNIRASAHTAPANRGGRDAHQRAIPGPEALAFTKYRRNLPANAAVVCSCTTRHRFVFFTDSTNRCPNQAEPVRKSIIRLHAGFANSSAFERPFVCIMPIAHDSRCFPRGVCALPTARRVHRRHLFH